MVKIHIGGKPYKLPTKWEEIDIHLLMGCTTPKEELSILGNIPPREINQLTHNQLFSLYQIIEFTHDHESLDGVLKEISCTQIYKDDVGPMIDFSSWEKLSKARKVIEPQYHKTYYNLAKIYFPSEKDTINILSLGYKLLEQLNTFLGSYEEMFNEPYEDDEVNAGVEDLNGFDIFGTAFTLAGEDILKMDEVLQMPAVVIYTALYYSFKKRKYQENLMKIREDKRKR
jgi:hypothetical protein